MQPYFFPYIGYFQLLMAVDTFIFYDDVNFIKKGWINRNRILLNGEEHLITVPCIKPSQNKLINETYINLEHYSIEKIDKTLYYAYSKAPYYEKISKIVKSVLSGNYLSIAELSAQSVIEVVNYLGLKKELKVSSMLNYDNGDLRGQDRILNIIIREGGSHYINAIGGMALYDKEVFGRKDIDLKFLMPEFKPYQQFSKDFVPGLSIIDLLMFESKEVILNMLKRYTLV